MRRYTATYVLEDGTQGELSLLARNDFEAQDIAMAALEDGPLPRLLRVRAA